MAVDLPTTRQNLNPSWFERGQPILAGDGATDKTHGFRGMSSETNHGFAYRTQVLCSDYTWDDRVIFSTGSASFQTAVIQHQVTLGAGVTTLQFNADITDAEIRITTDNDDGASTGTATGGTGRSVKTDTADMLDTTGIAVIITLAIKHVSGTAQLRAYSVREVVLTSGELT